MNLSAYMESLDEALPRNFIIFTIALVINCINGAFVYTYFKNQVFQRDPRYVLYIHLVINDMIMLTSSVVLQIMTYTIPLSFGSCCFMLLIAITTKKISPLNLAGMAVERYIAVCRPLHHMQICTVQRAYALIALIWVISFIPTVTDVFIVLTKQPLSVFSRIVNCYPIVVYNTQEHRALSVVTQALLFSFVFLTVFITYMKVFCAAQAASGSNQASARNARNTILLHGFQLLICMLSFTSPFVNLILLTLWPKKSTIIIFTTFLINGMLPRLLSPLIYGVRDKKFRSHMRLHFCCKCCSSAGKRPTLRALQRKSKKVMLERPKKTRKL